MNIEYILYKQPFQIETLEIVQYLYANNISLLPKYIIERNHEHYGITELPTIVCNNNIYSGLENTIKFYEQKSGITNLLNKAHEWKIQNPEYRINSRPS